MFQKRLISVRELEEYFFCPMLFYYRNALGMEVEKGLWADLGKEAQEECRELIRRNFEVIGEEVELRSDRLGLIGKVDFIVREREGIAPLEVKYSRRARIWWRYTLVAYSMLLEESSGKPVKHAYLYLEGGKIIKLNLKDRDRRIVLMAIEECGRIVDGKVPRRYESRSCKNCDFRQKCY
mgnify:CR=1 FL=1